MVDGEIYSFNLVTSIVQVSFSTSAITGVAPELIIELILAPNVKFGTITSSPLLTPNATNAICNAVVPLETATEKPPFKYEENEFSNFDKYAPFEDIHPLFIASVTLNNSSFPIVGSKIENFLARSLVE